MTMVIVVVLDVVVPVKEFEVVLVFVVVVVVVVLGSGTPESCMLGDITSSMKMSYGASGSSFGGMRQGGLLSAHDLFSALIHHSQQPFSQSVALQRPHEAGQHSVPGRR